MDWQRWLDYYNAEREEEERGEGIPFEVCECPPFGAQDIEIGGEK